MNLPDFSIFAFYEEAWSVCGAGAPGLAVAVEGAGGDPEEGEEGLAHVEGVAGFGEVLSQITER